MKIKALTKEELLGALPLIWNVFSDYEAVNYPEEGKQAFRNAIHDENYLDSLMAYGAFDHDALIGIIASRNQGSHLALFFVDGKYHKKGIGRKLWEQLLADNPNTTISVHSSLFAEDFYKALGFEQKGPMQEDHEIRYIPMEYRRERVGFTDVIQNLTDKNDKAAYAFSKELAAEAAVSDKYLAMIPALAELLDNKSSYIRTRAFSLICAQARWANEGQIRTVFDRMGSLLNDPKPTVVRQCLSALHELALYRPEMHAMILEAVKTIDSSKYKDSMSPLIEKDIHELLKVLS